MGTKVRLITIDTFALLGVASNLLSRNFSPSCSNVAESLLKSCYYSVFSTQRTIIRRTPTMGGRSSSPSQDASLNIWADTLLHPSLAGKCMLDNHLDVGNCSLECILNYSVKHRVLGEHPLFQSTDWGEDLVCVLLSPL